MHRPATALALAATTLALAACSNAPAPSAGATSTARMPGSTPAIVPAGTSATPVPSAASSAALPGDHASTRQYRIDINLPDLPANAGALGKTLRANADQAKREFVGNLPDPARFPELAGRPLSLDLGYKVTATTPAFISVIAQGDEDTGGAHPLPIETTFVLDRAAGRIITLDDLFAQPDAARKALAHFAHDTLLKRFLANAPTSGDGSPEAIRQWRTNMTQMLDDGTRPTAINYSLFVVRAGATADAASPGITLVFPPYQVAPYVDGTQHVDVPASVFADFLKPGYRGAFTDR